MRTSHSINWRTWLIRPALVAGGLSASWLLWGHWKARYDGARAAGRSRNATFSLPPLYDDNFWFNQFQDTQARHNRHRMEHSSIDIEPGVDLREIIRKVDDLEPYESEWWRRPLSTDPARPWRNPR